MTVDRRLLDAAFSLEFLHRHEHVLFVGLVGVGKSFLAQARVDHTQEKTFRSFLSPDLLIIDDFGLQKLTASQSTDLCELIIARHRKSSFIFTSNRAADEWLGLFDDPILGNSALARLANASYQVVIEGTSYRERLSPRETQDTNIYSFICEAVNLGQKVAMPDDSWLSPVSMERFQTCSWYRIKSRQLQFSPFYAGSTSCGAGQARTRP